MRVPRPRSKSWLFTTTTFSSLAWLYHASWQALNFLGLNVTQVPLAADRASATRFQMGGQTLGLQRLCQRAQIVHGGLTSRHHDPRQF